MAVTDQTDPHKAALTGYWSGLHSAWMLFQDVIRGDHSLEEVVESLGAIEEAFRDAADAEVVRETLESSQKMLNGTDPVELLREAIAEDGGEELLAQFDELVANTREGEIKLG